MPLQTAPAIVEAGAVWDNELGENPRGTRGMRMVKPLGRERSLGGRLGSTGRSSRPSSADWVVRCTQSSQYPNLVVRCTRHWEGASCPAHLQSAG